MFKENFACIKNNKRLQEDLIKISIESATENLAMAKANNGDTIFIKNDFPLDDTENPTQYAKNLVNDKLKSLSFTDKIFVIGFGVGYILDELYNNTKAKIVIWEPDILYLRFVFESIDLTPYFKDNRVFISNKSDECENFILKDYLNNDKLEFVTPKATSILYSKEFIPFSEKLYSDLQQKIINTNTIEKMSKKWTKNIISLAKSDKNFYDISVLENKYKDKTALILGAGPSLKDNIEQIKKHRDNFVIIAVNKTLKTLEANGIIPDFAVFVDADYIDRFYNLTDEYTSQIDIIAGYKTHNFVFNIPCKNLYIYTTDNESFIKKYNDILNLKIYESAGTTTIIAFYSAYHMGFKNIYFCGFDLAFKENLVNCEEAPKEITGNKVRIIYDDYTLTKVKSVTGEMVTTRDDYSIFIKQFEKIFNTLKLQNLYNITDFGAYIEGMQYTSFDKIDYSDKFGGKFEVNNEPYFDKTKFLECLKKEQEELIKIKELIEAKAIVTLIVNEILTETSFLYEYSQFDIIELTRNITNPFFVRTFNNKVLANIAELTDLL